MASSPYTNVNNVQFALSIGGTAYLTPPGFSNPLNNQIGPITAGGSLLLGLGLGQINYFGSYFITPQIPASGTATLNLSSGLTDVLNQQGITIVRLKGISIQLVSKLQDSLNGTACSSITWGASVVHPWNTILGNASLYTINSGAFWAHGDFSAVGVTVVAGSADELLITNNDPINAAAVRFSFFGCNA